jgi:hypothetical protein
VVFSALEIEPDEAKVRGDSRVDLASINSPSFRNPRETFFGTL